MTPKWLFEGLKPGDLAICTGCTIGLRLDSKMTLQLLTVSEVRFLEATKPDVLRAMREQQADKREMHREMALKRAKAATPASG